MNKIRKAIHSHIVRRRTQKGHDSVDSGSSAVSHDSLEKRDVISLKEVKRKRTLSISDSNNEFKKDIADQSTSLFFKTPLEIRERVYAELFGPGERIWIVLKSQKLACLREEQMNVSQQEDHVARLGMHVLPFLQSCRRIYSEAIDLLYSAPTFAFIDTLAFLAFSATILPSRFQHLRSISINLSGEGVPEHILKLAPGTYLSNPHERSLDYTFFHDTYRGTLYNTSVLPPQNKNRLIPSYMWDAVAHALKEMKGLQDVFLSLRHVPRLIVVWVEHGYEHSGKRDARDIQTSLEWVGRDRPWKGEGSNESEEGRGKRKETKIVFENVWRKSSDEWKRGHWVREIYDDAEVEWKEVGEAAAPWYGEILY